MFILEGVFAVEGLDDLHSLDRLLREGVEMGQVSALLAVVLSGPVPEDEGSQDQEGQDAEGDEREGDVDPEQGGGDGDDLLRAVFLSGEGA